MPEDNKDMVPLRPHRKVGDRIRRDGGFGGKGRNVPTKMRQEQERPGTLPKDKAPKDPSEN